MYWISVHCLLWKVKWNWPPPCPHQLLGFCLSDILHTRSICAISCRLKIPAGFLLAVAARTTSELSWVASQISRNCMSFKLRLQMLGLEWLCGAISIGDILYICDLHFPLATSGHFKWAIQVLWLCGIVSRTDLDEMCISRTSNCFGANRILTQALHIHGNFQWNGLQASLVQWRFGSTKEGDWLYQGAHLLIGM